MELNLFAARWTSRVDRHGYALIGPVSCPVGPKPEGMEAAYPNWDTAALVLELTPVWHRHAEAAGVRFESVEDGPDIMDFI